MQRPVPHRRFVTWLAMAAMWLIVAGPVISRVAPTLHAVPDHAVMAMHADGHEGHPAHPEPPHQHLLDKCAYCDLLGHSPVVAGVPWVPPQLPHVRVLPASPPVTLPWSRRIALFPPPRGPPLFAGG